MRKGLGCAILLLVALANGARAEAQTPDQALASAVTANDLDGANEALKQKANPNERLAYGATPLAWAVNTQNRDMVQLLLKAGAKPSAVDEDGVSPLSLACELGDPQIMGQLLDARADVTASMPDGTGIFAVCARFGSPDIVARMIAAGAALDAVDSKGLTPLMWAAAAGKVETIKLLLTKGADVNRVSKAGFSPLFFAIKSNVLQATEVLLAAGADASHRGPEGTSAAQLAAYQKNTAAAALLVEHGGVDLAARDREGYQLLHVAAASGDLNLVRLLLARGADPNGISTPSRIQYVGESNASTFLPPQPLVTPLLRAAVNGHADVMAALVAGGADPKFVANNGMNVVLAAVRGGYVKPLEFALKIAPNPDVADENGTTALVYLLTPGNNRRLEPELEQMIQCLAEHGARTDIPTKRGLTAAAIAADEERVLTVIRTMYFKYFPNKPATRVAVSDKALKAVATAARTATQR